MVKTQAGIYTIVIAVFVAGIFLFERVSKNSRRKRLCYQLLLAAYCVSVLWVTLFSRQMQSERIALLIPFESYSSSYQDYLDNVAASAKDGVVTMAERVRSALYGYNWLILNVLLFVPYGILAPKACLKTKRSKLFFAGVLGSAVIELIQYIFKLGCFDVDDLIQNTMGICIGFLLAALLCRSHGAQSEQLAEKRGGQSDG